MLQLKGPHSPSAPVKWEDLDAVVDSPNESIGEAEPQSPPTVWLDPKEMAVYGSTPMEPSVPVVQCPDCDKPVKASAILTHKNNCEKIRKLQAKNKNSSVGGKRKAEDDPSDATGPAKKKGKKDAPKGGTKRIKGPTHLDKHCYVINDKGLPCSRSITCKVHSMVAKRAVVGRSKPYDELLLDWKREHIPDFVEPVKKETKAEKKAKKEAEKEAKRLEMLAQGIVPGKKAKAPKGETKKTKKTDKTSAGEKGAKKATKAGTVGPPGDEDEDEEEMDSDVEFDVLVGAARAMRPTTAVPLAQPINMSNFFVARNEILRNCYDTMGFGLSGNNIRGHAMSIVAA